MNKISNNSYIEVKNCNDIEELERFCRYTTNRLKKLVKEKNKSIVSNNKFKVGDIVKFYHKSDFQQGVIKRIMKVNAVVDIDIMEYKVPISLLELVFT